MRKAVVSIIGILAMLCVMATGLYAEEQKAETPKVTGSTTAAFLSQYIFRGYELSSSSMVIQPAINLSYYGFSASLWGNLDTNQTPTQSFFPSNPGAASWNETDLTLSYTHNIGKLSLTGGYIWYGTEYTKQTQELFVALGYDIITKPVLTVYQDISRFPGTYFQLGFSHSMPVYKEVTLDLGASFSYMWGQGDYWKTFKSSTGAYTGSKYSAFHAGMVSAGFSIPVAKNFVIQPIAQFWFPLSGDASRRVDGVPFNPNGNVDNTFVYGLNAIFNF